MKIPFKYYLHDDYNSMERAEEIAQQISAQQPGLINDLDDFNELIGNPFYEVTLECEIDTDTGVVTLLKATL